MVIAEIGFGLKALKSAFDIAKEVKDLNDTTAIHSKVIEMQSLIIEAQNSAIEARDAHSQQMDRIRELERENRTLKEKNDELDHYELIDLGWGAFAYMLKPEFRGDSPPFWACANCYKKKDISILQNVHGRTGPRRWTCPSCQNQIDPHFDLVRWKEEIA